MSEKKNHKRNLGEKKVGSTLGKEAGGMKIKSRSSWPSVETPMRVAPAQVKVKPTHPEQPCR